ncbi:DUF488 family protein [Geminocystis sp. CENA526]|uniref:DUF488 domain-containing protein n=1 Tax=Geminocystis sp. CENA526 TaxID=1355871 RepID=UPI003D6DF552
MQPLFTIGHSNYNPEYFIELLQKHNISALGDVRSTPYSRYLPHFSQKQLQRYLAQHEILYVFLGGELGARPDNQSCYVNGKAIYENIAKTEKFGQGIQRILKGVENHRIALMCAEKDPLTCHRAILVCQHLVPFNLEIAHIHSDGDLEFHEDLEERMLKQHNLQDNELEGQLSLFTDILPPPMTKEERLKQAYQKQGLKIAYVESE